MLHRWTLTTADAFNQRAGYAFADGDYVEAARLYFLSARLCLTPQGRDVQLDKARLALTLIQTVRTAS